MHPETGEHIIFAERKPIDFAQVDQFVSAFNGVSAPVDRGNDVVVAAGDRLKLTGIASDADDEAYYASIIAKLQERDRQRSSELARRNNWIANENAIGADVQFKLGTAPIRETVVPAPISVETPTVADQSDERWVPNPDGIGGSVVAQPMTPSETDAIDAQIRQGTNDAMVIGGVSRRDGSDWVNPYDATDGWDFRWNPGGQTTVRITLDLVGCGLQKAGAGGTGQGETLIEVPAQRKRCGMAVRLVIGGSSPGEIKREPDPTLLALMAKGKTWLQQFTREGQAIEMIAEREKFSVRYVNRVINVALLAPDIVQAIERGEHPAEVNATKLLTSVPFPVDWAAQRQVLGMAGVPAA